MSDTGYQYRVVWKHEGFPKHYKVCEKEDTAERWYNFIKNEWDLHWKCDDYDTNCEWAGKDPNLLELYVEMRFVEEWGRSSLDKFAPVGKSK